MKRTVSRSRARAESVVWSPLLALLLALSLPGAPRAAAEPAAPGHIDAGFAGAVEAAVSAYNAQRFAEARSHFERAHALRPSARTLRGLGACDLELGRYDAAVEELSAALADGRSPLAGELRAQTEARLAAARAQLQTATVAESTAAPPTRAPTAPAQTSASAAPSAQVERAPARPDPRPARWSTTRWLALGLGSLGIAGVLVGGSYGLRSIAQGNTRDRFCDREGACRDARGVRAADAAMAAGDVATIGFSLGGALLLAGAALLWAAPSAAKPERRAELTFTRSSLALGGRW